MENVVAFILNSNIIINHSLEFQNHQKENNNCKGYCQNQRCKAEMETSKTVSICQHRFTYYLKYVSQTREKPGCTSCFFLPIGLCTIVGQQTIVNVFNDFYRSSN